MDAESIGDDDRRREGAKQAKVTQIEVLLASRFFYRTLTGQQLGGAILRQRGTSQNHSSQQRNIQGLSKIRGREEGLLTSHATIKYR